MKIVIGFIFILIVSSAYSQHRYGTTNADNLRLRSAPSVDAEIITVLKQGEKVMTLYMDSAETKEETLNGATGKWVKVVTVRELQKNFIGWCFDGFLDYNGVYSPPKYKVYENNFSLVYFSSSGYNESSATIIGKSYKYSIHGLVCPGADALQVLSGDRQIAYYKFDNKQYLHDFVLDLSSANGLIKSGGNEFVFKVIGNFTSDDKERAFYLNCISTDSKVVRPDSGNGKFVLDVIENGKNKYQYFENFKLYKAYFLGKSSEEEPDGYVAFDNYEFFINQDIKINVGHIYDKSQQSIYEMPIKITITNIKSSKVYSHQIKYFNLVGFFNSPLEVRLYKTGDIIIEEAMGHESPVNSIYFNPETGNFTECFKLLQDKIGKEFYYFGSFEIDSSGSPVYREAKSPWDNIDKRLETFRFNKSDMSLIKREFVD